jgi:hypothetical protein
MTDERWKTVFLCLAVILICGSGYTILAARVSAANAFVLLAAATLCGVLAHIDRLESFSASVTGVKATLRKLSDTVETAETLIASLKRMQLAYAKAVFKLVSDPDVAENRDKYARRDAAKKLVLEEAERVGLDQAQIREILGIEKNSVCSEYAAAVYHYAHQHLNGVGTNEFQAEINPLMSTHLPPTKLKRCQINSA